MRQKSKENGSQYFNLIIIYFQFTKVGARKGMDVMSAFDAIYICLCTNLCTYLFIHLCERKKSLIKISTLFLYLKL